MPLVKVALASVAKISEAGNSVHLTPKDPHIINEKTKEKTAQRKEGSVYVMDLWVKVPSPPCPRSVMVSRRHDGCDIGMCNLSWGFTQQAR